MSARVLHVIESLDHGGAERVVVDLASAQSGSGVACLKRRGPLVANLPDHVDLHVLGKPEGIDLRIGRRLARLIRHGAYDFVHTHAWGVFLDGALAARRAGVRHVHTVHGPLPRVPRSLVGRLKAAARLMAERRLARRCSAVIAVSDSVARSARLRLGGARVQTIRNGIADRAVADRPRHAAPRLISVGRLDPVKDHATLLRALVGLTGRWPRIELLIVGDGPERGALERQVDRTGLRDNVRFLGFRDDVPDLLGTADLFVMSSRHEGISIAMLEAMRAGLPIVATEVGGVSETVCPGESALLVDVGDSDALAAAMAKALGEPDLAASLGAAARVRQRDSFSLDSMARAYDRVYAGDRRGRGLDILYHHRTQGRGAEGVHIASIVRALEDMGHRVTIVGPAGVDPLATAGAAPVDKSVVSTKGAGAVWSWVSRRLPGAFFELAEIGYNLLAWRQLRRAMRERRYDIVYERYAFYLVAGAMLAARRRIPFVLEINEVSGLEDRARAQCFPRLCARFERFLFRRCTGVLPVSSYLADAACRQGMPPRRVTVVPNAVDETVLRPLPRDRELVQRYGLNGRTVIGFVGWFDHWDRLDLLLEVCARLRPRHPDLALLLVGDGPEATRLRQRTRELGLDGSVVMTGAVARDRVHQHMALLDVAVLAHSNRFGSPVVLFELMARRVPVVAPRLAPICDVLEDESRALLFDPLDIDGLTRAVERLLVSPALRSQIATAAYERLGARHTWSRNAEQILVAAGHRVAIPFANEEVRRVS